MAYFDPTANRNACCTVGADYRSEAQKILDAQSDPSYFVSFCFTDPAGEPLRQAPLHRELQEFLCRHRKALIELPRDHGKSVQICARAIWELGRNPSLRIKIVCANEGIAAERGRFLREAIRRNHNVHLVFPSLRSAAPWSETRFTIERPANAIGPTATALGVGAGLTGTRADLLICDDIVDVKSLVSRAERERIKAFFQDNLLNLLEPDGRCWCLFTPWHRDDLNAHMKRNAGFKLFRRAVSRDLKPVWSERWPRERLEERKQEIGAASFARGYRLEPLCEEEAVIQAGWVRYWNAEESRQSAVGSRQTAEESRQSAVGSRQTAEESRQSAVGSRQTAEESRQSAVGSRQTAEESRQSAVGSRQTAEESRQSAVGSRQPEESRQSAVGSRQEGQEMDRVIMAVDPAVSLDVKADASALVVLGAKYGELDRSGNPGPINEIRCLDAIARRVRIPELVNLIDQLDRRWQPQAILFESNAGFLGIKDLLMRHAGFGPKIVGINQSKSKAVRIEAFSVPVRNGVFRLKGVGEGEKGRGGEGEKVDPSQQALFDEMTTFPVGEHDDLLDAAAMGTEYLLNTREPRIWLISPFAAV